MTLITVRLRMSEGDSPVVACAAIFTRQIIGFCNFRAVSLHPEFELGMAHSAGVFAAVAPVRKGGGFHPAPAGGTVNQNVSVFLGRREWGKDPGP